MLRTLPKHLPPTVHLLHPTVQLFLLESPLQDAGPHKVVCFPLLLSGTASSTLRILFKAPLTVTCHVHPPVRWREGKLENL